jgi:hypothetical protein
MGFRMTYFMLVCAFIVYVAVLAIVAIPYMIIAFVLYELESKIGKKVI